MYGLQDQAFAFGEYLLIPKERLLLRSGEPVRLTGKALDLLIVLVRRNGRLVTKDELMEEVWPDTLVQETNLTVNISALRKVLDPERNGSGMIETVPGRGYRFAAPVVVRDAAPAPATRAVAAEEEPCAATPSATPAGGLHAMTGVLRSRWRSIGAAVCIALATVALWFARTGDTTPPFHSVAVLPFTSDSPDSEYLAEGLREAVLNGLVQLRNLRVIPRATAAHFRGPAVVPAKAGRELGVSAVVTATISQHDERLRVQVDLVDVERNSQVWGARYEGNGSELLQLQANILQDLPSAIGVPADERDARRPPQRLTGNPDAYRAYLHGRHEWSQRSQASLTRAIEHFRTAVAIDPRFAAAYSGLADTYSILGYLSYLAPFETFPAARRYALRALELDPSLSEAHASLGFVRLYFDWDWAGAEEEFVRAIALDPDHAAAHQWYAIFLLAAGRPAAAFRQIELAQQRDPLSLPVNTDLGFYYYYTGQHDEAVKQLRLVLDMNPSFAPAHLWLGRAYEELGEFDAAIDEFRRVEDRVPDWPVTIAAWGHAAGVAGRFGLARQALARLTELSSQRFVTSYGVALVEAGLGRPDAAFASLERAFDERSNWLVWLRLDPRWKSLRADPRFSELVRRMRFPPPGE